MPRTRSEEAARSHKAKRARPVPTQELEWRARRRWGSPLRWRCVYCGARSPRMEVDHFLPYSMGGDSTVKNLVPACPTCNGQKLNRDPVAWMAAVGVHAAWAEELARVSLLTHWRVSASFEVPVSHLDYAAGRAVRGG